MLCNTHIGNNVIVAAGSVVTKDLADDGVYAGVPARKICTIQEYRDKYQQLRAESPDFNKVRPWYDWKNSTDEERCQMAEKLRNDIGFI